MKVTLLPCPCCGGEACYSPSDHATRADGRVYCRDCYMEVEETHGSEPVGVAVEKWNKRASDGVVKELKHLIRLMEPLEREGGFNIPGLATLNGAREALRKLEEGVRVVETDVEV